MKNLNCSSIHKHPEAEFFQLNAVIKDARRNLDAFETRRKSFNAPKFELPQKLVILLQNLDDLSTLLFNETKSKINEDQKMYLMQCKRTVVTFYCYINHFIELFPDKDKREFNADANEKTRRLAYEFYRYASSELRTPFYNLKLYSQARTFEPETNDWEEFVNRIFSTPFVPENQDKVDKISYWVDVLGEFMDDLPRLWQELSDEDTA